MRKVFRVGGNRLSALCYGRGANSLQTVSGKQVTIFDPASERIFRSYQLPTDNVMCADWASWGHHLAVGTPRGVEIYDAWTGALIVKTPQHINIVSKVAWSPSQEYLAISVGVIRIWRTATESYVRLLDGPGGEAALAWNRDSTLLATANSSGTVVIWDVQSGRPLHRIQACSTIISALSWSLDGRFLAMPATTRGWNRNDGINITIFDFHKGEVVAEMQGHGSMVTGLSFHPFGAAYQNLFVSRGSGEMRLWRGDNWQCVAVVPEKPSNYVLSPIAFHPHGSEFFVSGDDDKEVCCWKFDRRILKLEAPCEPSTGDAAVIDLSSPESTDTATTSQRTPKYNILVSDVENAQDSNEKGRMLECLCRELFLSVQGFKVKSNVLTHTEEIDLSIQNWGVDIAWLERVGFYILAECKNWSGKCGKNEFVLFQEKLRNRRRTCNLGFLISWNGFADTVDLEAMRGSREDYVVALVSGDDLKEAVRTGDFTAVLFRAYDNAVMN